MTKDREPHVTGRTPPSGRVVGSIHDLADELGGDAADAWAAVADGQYVAWRRRNDHAWTIIDPLG